MVGPAIGGYTAEPATQYPHSVFAKYEFFSTYPYFIPCLLAGLLNILAVVLGALYLEEVRLSSVIDQLARLFVSQYFFHVLIINIPSPLHMYRPCRAKC
jgi:hypothetical protein